MNKQHLIDSLTKVLSTKKESRDAVERIFSEIKKAVRDGRKVVISGFGSFSPVVTRAKKCRNPRTGESMHISPRRKVRFKQAKDLF